MVRYVPVLIELGLLVYGLIDCLQTESTLVRVLPKPGWILLIIVLPLIGPVAWLVAGRPARAPGDAVAWRSTATGGFPEYERPSPAERAAAEIDARLRAEQARVDREHDDAVRRWEQGQRELRKGVDDGPSASPA